MVIALIDDNQEFSRRRVGYVPDAADDAVTNQLVLHLHGKSIPNIANRRSAIFTCGYISAVG